MTGTVIQRVDQAQFTAGLAKVLRTAYGERRSALKLIAQDAGANERSAKNWSGGKNAPDALHLLRLAARRPEIAAFLRDLTITEAAGEDGAQQLALFAGAWERP